MLIITLILVALLAWFLWRNISSNTERHKIKHRHPHEQHPYHSVSVETESSACKAQDKIKNTRFLSDDAPPLPLPNCQAKDCQCHYQHYEDRRDPHGTRRNDFGLSHDLFGGDGQLNRRDKKSDRRINHRPAY